MEKQLVNRNIAHSSKTVLSATVSNNTSTKVRQCNTSQTLVSGSSQADRPRRSGLRTTQ